MFGLRLRAGWLIRGLLACVLLMPVLSACTVVAGGGVAVAVIAIGALTSHCYDYLDVSVFDAQGRKTCAATVTATNGGSEFELQSCYYAPLSDGRWTLRASLPGMSDAMTTVEVEHKDDCTRHTQSVELSLGVPGAAPRSVAPAPVNSVKPAPVAPPAVNGAPASSAPATSTVPVPAAPPALATSAVPTSSAAPATSAAPPVGAFPN
jgi:hypothetical protein